MGGERMERADVILSVPPDVAAELDGLTFQAHAFGEGQVRLFPVTIDPDARRCPVVVGGERCGKQAGHEGRHQWAGGD